MFLIYQNIIKFISSIFSFLIFTTSFFLLQLSISFTNITPIEFLIKPFLVNKIDGYDNSFSEAVLYIDTDSKKTIAKIKIDLTNKVKSEQFQLSSEFETNLVDIINFDYNYSFSSSLINKNIKFTKKNNLEIIRANGKINSKKLELFANGTQIPVSLVKSLWPENTARGAKNWVQKNLTNGIISNLSLTANIPLDSFKISKKLRKEHINLKFNFEEMTISFLKEMDSIYNSMGKAVLNGQSFEVYLEKGQVLGKNHKSIDIYDSKFIAKEILKRHGPAEILINAKGSLDDVMIFIFQHPRNFKRFVPVKLENISANSNLKVKFDFPLKSKIKFEEFIINSKTNLSDVIINDIFSRNFSSNLLSINLTNNGINIVGEINSNKQGLNLVWKQDFKKKNNSTSISLSGYIDEKMLNGLVNNEIKFTGKVKTEANFVGNSFNFNKGDLLLDFRDVKIESYILDWAKPRFSSMVLKSDIIFLDSNEIDFNNFQVEGPLIQILGDFKFKNNRLLNLNLEKFKFYSSKDKISNNLQIKYTNNFSSSLELSILGDVISIGRDGLSNLLNNMDPSNNYENIIINVFFDELNSKSNITYKNAEFSYDKKLNKLKELSFSAFLNSEPIIYGETSEHNNTKKIELFAVNFESLIDVLGLNINLKGGPIKYSALIENIEGFETFSGNLNVDEFSILKLPIFAKLLNISIPNLTLDVNSGIEFKKASAEIKINSKGIFINDGVIKAKSDLPIFDNSLGMSISGVYGFSELTNIEGTLVPLASINRVPSKIPFVGGLFKGDNEGEGLIGIKYKIYEDEDGLIKIQSNPLSILAPGILQRVF